MQGCPPGNTCLVEGVEEGQNLPQALSLLTCDLPSPGAAPTQGTTSAGAARPCANHTGMDNPGWTVLPQEQGSSSPAPGMQPWPLAHRALAAVTAVSTGRGSSKSSGAAGATLR